MDHGQGLVETGIPQARKKPVKKQEYARVKQLFLQAISLKKEARAAFLERVCSQNEAIKAEVISLLANHVEQKGYSDANPPQIRTLLSRVRRRWNRFSQSS